ncbi:MAG: hypothetical protein U0V04_03315 [Spirosomataceae bacterium]|jgi:hypothetical protein
MKKKLIFFTNYDGLKNSGISSFGNDIPYIDDSWFPSLINKQGVKKQEKMVEEKESDYEIALFKDDSKLFDREAFTRFIQKAEKIFVVYHNKKSNWEKEQHQKIIEIMNESTKSLHYMVTSHGPYSIYADIKKYLEATVDKKGEVFESICNKIYNEEGESIIEKVYQDLKKKNVLEDVVKQKIIEVILNSNPT